MTPRPSAADRGDAGEDVVGRLERWRQFGGVWRVASRTPETVTISLCRCDGGEEVERLTSNDPSVLQWLAERTTNEQRPLR